MSTLEAELEPISSQGMGPTTQSPKAEEDIHALLPNNPYVPPTGDTCYINSLPSELLTHIFEVGAMDDLDDRAQLERSPTFLKEGYKVEMADDEEGEIEEEEEGDDEEWSDVTRSSDCDSPSPFQIVVSHVCRHWRNVAFSIPTLWTVIYVPPNSDPPYAEVSILLEHSKALPIDIFVDNQESDYDPRGNPHVRDNLKYLYSLLVPHVQRWRSITVLTRSYLAIYAFLSAVSDPSVPAASQLAELELGHYSFPDVHGPQPKLSTDFTLFGGSAPNLTKLTLMDIHLDWNQGWMASASNLRCLKLVWQREEVRPTWAQFATILRGAPQLETLVLFNSGPSGDPTQWTFEPTPGGSTKDLNAPIQLLNLTDFVLGSGSPSYAIGFLPKFYLPSLKRLTLDLIEGDFTDLIDQLAGPATSLYSFSAQERPRSLLSRLEKLIIPRVPCRSEGVETLYGELQNLESLEISPSFVLPQFVDLLCQPCTLLGRGDIWLPRLKSLWINDGTGDMIRRVVQSRKDAGVPLKALHVGDECDVGDDDVEWFEENVETCAFFLKSRSWDDY